ncbi:GerMN domain-containing protein [Kineococcus sp. SYSU DK006]|uniref:GerMN domain-containing protein n=1 Tax=Kineococcus sp. SYSU DK006 TaxID=3383127 RepID=UPI003D7E8C69
MRARAVRVLAAAALAAGALSAAGACGTPTDGQPRTITSGEVPHGLLDPKQPPTADGGAAASTGSGPQAYFLTTEQLLVPLPVLVPEPVPADPGAVGSGEAAVLSALLQRLSAGPDEGERARGLASALGPGVALGVDGLHEGVAHITVGGLGDNLAADRLPLAIAQVVLTATSTPGVQAVQLVRDGQVLEVPLPGGQRTAEPLRADDYGSLRDPAGAAPAP